MSSLVQIQKLRKTFGPIIAVDQVSFSVNKGEVLGFLGPNGAGKSTTMKMITGFLTPTEGSVQVNGYDIQEQPIEAKRCLGYLPEGAPAYGDMTPWSFLLFIGEMRGFRGDDLKRRVAETVKKVNLENVIEQPIETLSKGFKRRVGLAQAIIHDPAVLILDEPTDGLDPNQKHEVRSLIKAMAKDKAIILSTHILEEVQAVCSRAMIIAKGKVVTDGTPKDLEARSRYHNAVVLRLRTTDSEVKGILEGISGVKAVEELESYDDTTSYRLLAEGGKPILEAVNSCVLGHEWNLVEISVEHGQLDDVFRSLTMPTQAIT